MGRATRDCLHAPQKPAVGQFALGHVFAQAPKANPIVSGQQVSTDMVGKPEHRGPLQPGLPGGNAEDFDPAPRHLAASHDVSACVLVPAPADSPVVELRNLRDHLSQNHVDQLSRRQTMLVRQPEEVAEERLDITRAFRTGANAEQHRGLQPRPEDQARSGRQPEARRRSVRGDERRPGWRLGRPLRRGARAGLVRDEAPIRRERRSVRDAGCVRGQGFARQWH